LKKLVELIGSLEKNEKRYFKRYANMYSGNKQAREFMVLYEIIDGHDEKKNKTIKDKIKDAKLKNPAAIGTYLYNTLLTALTDYHRKLSPELELLNNQQQFIILQKKGLYNQMYSLLKQMQKKVDKVESITYELTQLRYEYNLKISQNFLEKRADLYDEFHEKVIGKCKILLAQSQINLFNSEISKKVKKGYQFTAEETNRIIENEWFFKESLDDLQPNVVNSVYFSKMLLYFNQDPIDWDMFHETTMERFEFVVLKQPDKISMFNKIASIYNVTYSCFMTSNLKDLKNLQELFRSNKLSDKFHVQVQEIIGLLIELYLNIIDPEQSYSEGFLMDLYERYKGQNLQGPDHTNISIPFFEFGFFCAIVEYSIINKLFDKAETFLFEIDSFNSKDLNIKDRIRYCLLNLILVFQNPKNTDSIKSSEVRKFKYLIDQDASLEPMIFELYQFFSNLQKAYLKEDQLIVFQVMFKRLSKMDVRDVKKLNLLAFYEWVNFMVSSRETALK